jgi:UDP-2,3-diacylglucosamine pyrophosphatase LpxH
VDIFGGAGQDLVHFLHALASVHPEVRQRLHFIHLGDMFELWMGRSYQFLPGAGGRPEWKSPGSPDLVADWALEVMMQNTLVFPALEQLERAGLAEVRYLGGNHDGYLMKPEVAGQLGIPTREPYLRALNADLLVEHGHRFDAPNFDNTQGSRLASGPTLTNIAYWLIPARSLEPWGRAVMGLISPRSRDTHMLGPALVHLDERFNQHQKPFSIYAMAHTHAPMLVRFEIGSKYTTTDHEEASRGRVLP